MQMQFQLTEVAFIFRRRQTRLKFRRGDASISDRSRTNSERTGSN
jgi:hypothetical protein